MLERVWRCWVRCSSRRPAAPGRAVRGRFARRLPYRQPTTKSPSGSARLPRPSNPMRHSFVSFLALAAGLTLAQAANAQPARIDLSTPPPPPAVQRTHHVHDGFYTRLSLGVGSLGLDFDDDGSRNVDLDGSGLAFSADIMIGGSPSPGVAIGGALLGTASFSLELEQNGRSVGDRDVGMVILGPFIDGFPNPKQGWHIGGAVGVAGM